VFDEYGIEAEFDDNFSLFGFREPVLLVLLDLDY
jgi:hypothetical protein